MANLVEILTKMESSAFFMPGAKLPPDPVGPRKLVVDAASALKTELAQCAEVAAKGFSVWQIQQKQLLDSLNEKTPAVARVLAEALLIPISILAKMEEHNSAPMGQIPGLERLTDKMIQTSAPVEEKAAPAPGQFMALLDEMAAKPEQITANLVKPKRAYRRKKPPKYRI